MKIKDRLETAKGKLEVGATHDFIDDLAPVYAGIDDLVLVAPETGAQVKAKVKKAEAPAKADKTQEAAQQVDEVANDIVATRIHIPIAYVQGQIDAAREALSGQDIDAAHKDVRRAIDSLLVLASGSTWTPCRSSISQRLWWSVTAPGPRTRSCSTTPTASP